MPIEMTLVETCMDGKGYLCITKDAC